MYEIYYISHFENGKIMIFVKYVIRMDPYVVWNGTMLRVLMYIEFHLYNQSS